MSYSLPFFTCIYCGYHSRLIRFRYKIKTGYSKKLFQCPDCNNIMRRNTLIKRVTPREWARFLYSAIRLFKIDYYDRNLKQDFFSRIDWEKLFDNLKILGISFEFWKAWKEIKSQGADYQRIVDEFDTPDKLYRPKQFTKNGGLKDAPYYEER